jgi:hypothetical protein
MDQINSYGLGVPAVAAGGLLIVGTPARFGPEFRGRVQVQHQVGPGEHGYARLRPSFVEKSFWGASGRFRAERLALRNAAQYTSAAAPGSVQAAIAGSISTLAPTERATEVGAAGRSLLDEAQICRNTAVYHAAVGTIYAGIGLLAIGAGAYLMATATPDGPSRT